MLSRCKIRVRTASWHTTPKLAARGPSMIAVRNEEGGPAWRVPSASICLVGSMIVDDNSNNKLGDVMYELIEGLRIESVYIHTYSAIAFSILFVGISFQAHLTRRRSAILPAILIDMPVCIVLRSNGQRRCTCGKMCVARFLVDFTQREFHFWCVHVSPPIMFPPQPSKKPPEHRTFTRRGGQEREERRIPRQIETEFASSI